MSTRYFYIRLICYILLIIGLSGLGVWLFFKDYSFALIFLVALVILLVSFKILSSFDKIQEKITYFFNAVENEDSTLYFSENMSYKPLRELNKSLNRINMLIREAKLKNREQEQYFAALLEQVTTGIVVLNAKGNILQANTEAKKLLNYNTLTHIVQLKRVDENLYRAFEMLNTGNRQLVKLTHNNNTTQLVLQATDFESSNEAFTLVSIQDIRNELDAKEVEAWLKLIRVLTHEIMNSITPITSLSETLLGYYTDDTIPISVQTTENTIKGLEVIKERGIGLIQFVESYRKLTKIPAPILKTLELKPFIEHLVLLVEDENITFKYQIIPENLTIDADEGQISQVLLNLIKNATQAVSGSENPIIKIVANLSENNRPQISVSDNGNGISEELLEQIFVPFFTTKENGSGVGLSISRQIMRNHGGNIKVISEEGKGSQFVLEF
ncbi:MAG: hypothetical protein CR987_00635 [Draconibacterium sp.]|nr:MAG: hypothetical protein CR987_00635 [Draconibacterium sp.]